MCGFVGFFDVAGVIGDHKATLAAMAATIAHRGPDDEGIWTSERDRVGFGFRRLAIQDLSPFGHQPMASTSGRFTIAFNGEVYNFRELRSELEASGHRFRGHSDTEVMLASFERWGVRDALPKFVGMFAFAVWDADERRLLLARDRLGVKPLYVGVAGDADPTLASRPLDGRTTFVFASELKPFRRIPAMRLDVDRDALASYMRYAYVPGPWSIHRSIRKLQPGHLLSIDARGMRLECWWSTKDAAESGARAPFRGSDAEAIEALDERLRASVRIRMIADVPLGAFLSGGIDSSAVVAAMCAEAPGAVRTFTIGVRDPTYDEAPHAKRIAEHLGTTHIEHYVEPDEALRVIPSLPTMFDEPFADSSQIPTAIVSAAARRHVTVILSGDGGDELFGGYYRYRWVRTLWRRLARLPMPLRAAAARALRMLPARAVNAALRPLQPALPRSLRMNTPGDRAHKLAGLLTSRDPWELFHRLTSIVQEPTRFVLGAHEPLVPLRDPSALADVEDLETRMMQADMASYLVDDILVKVDRASMAASLEAREPLLDHRLVEFALRLPTSMKIRGGTTKWLLREVLHRRVPRELLDRPKQGFSIPIDAWLAGPLRDWAESLLDERRLRSDGWFDPAAVRGVWTAQLAGGRMQYQLWNVLMFQAWLDATASDR